MPRKPFIPVAEPFLGEEEVKNVVDAIRSGWISSKGEYIDSFEKNFARFSGTKFASSMANGTVALHVALVALGIGKGDEVIVPDMTYVATANAVTYTGAKPVFVDVDEKTWCIDSVSAEKAVTKNTKAIIPVHLYGNVADMDAIMRIAKKYNLYVIEDAAEAHGAEFKGRPAGSIGDLGAFSFFANKVITTGEGGMVVTNNKKLHEHISSLKNQGKSGKRYWHPEIGYNYRMTNVQAAIGVAQLKKINRLLKMKKQVFGWYKKYLRGLNDLQINFEAPLTKSVYWMTCLVLNNGLKVSRDSLIKKLDSEGVETRPFFYPVSQMPMYAGENKDAKIRNKVSYSISSRGINLPSSARLKESDVSHICRVLRNCIK